MMENIIKQKMKKEEMIILDELDYKVEMASVYGELEIISNKVEIEEECIFNNCMEMFV